MHRTTLRLGFLAAMMATVVGGAAFLADAPKAHACTNGIPCYVLALPDLRVTNIDADPLGNGKTRVEFWVKNEGTANSSGGMFRVDIAGVGVWWGVLDSVTKGATKFYSFDITSPPTPPNSRLVQVCADATSKVTELNEANNCLTQSEQTTAFPLETGS